MEDEKYKVQVENHVKVENHVEYLISIVGVPSNSKILFSEKYTNLRNLYDLMKKESKTKNFPPFAPNKLFGYEEENFVIQRTKDLNKFFEEINNNENYSNLPSLKKFILTNLKNRKSNIKVAKHPQMNEIKYNINNQRTKDRAKLFKNDFYKGNEENHRRLEPQDFDKIENDVNQIGKKFEKKFVKINYDIKIKKNEKNEKKYNDICKFDKTDNITNQNILDNTFGNDNNFELIGKNEDYINIKIEKNINSYIKINMDKFKYLSNLFDENNLLLK